MIIALTGSGTFIGKNLYKYLSKRHTVYPLYYNSKPNIGKKKSYKHNLEEEGSFNKNFHTLIHCASKIPTDGINKNNYIKNLKITKNIIKICKRNKCKHIIFLSAMSVYGKNTYNEVFENKIGERLDLYGKSKIESEKIFLKFAKENKIIVTIFRLPGIVGKECKEIFLEKLKKKILINKRLTCYNHNKKFNNILHVDNLVEIINRAIIVEKKNNIYNLGSKYPINLKTLFHYVYNILKIKKNFDISYRKKPHYIINIGKILKKRYKINSTKKSLFKFIREK